MKSSATETKDTINATLDAFLATVSDAVSARRQQLLDEVQQVCVVQRLVYSMSGVLLYVISATLVKLCILIYIHPVILKVDLLLLLLFNS